VISNGNLYNVVSGKVCVSPYLLSKNYANCLDSRLRGNDGRLGKIVIPAKAGIQESMPELIEKLQNMHTLV
jgi:hypothetical protein